MNLQPYIERIRATLDYTRFEQEWAAMKSADHKPKSEHEKDCGVCVKQRVLRDQDTNTILTVMADMLEEMCGEDERTQGKVRSDNTTLTNIDYRAKYRNSLRADLREQIATLRKEIQK